MFFPAQCEHDVGRCGTVSACAFLFAVVFTLALGAAELSASQDNDDLARRRRDYEREDDAVGKAKKIPKLGDAQFAAARTAMRDAKYADAVQLLTEYRDLVFTTHEMLLAEVPNPEKKSGGFKHMEIHVRKSLHQLEDIIAAAPLNEREPLEAIRADLEKISRQLIRDLFPRQPGMTQASKP
ncbi:MAG: hypothetical protein ACRD5F_16785 [Candidatus Acidiferrales bacterium]